MIKYLKNIPFLLNRWIDGTDFSETSQSYLKFINFMIYLLQS